MMFLFVSCLLLGPGAHAVESRTRLEAKLRAIDRLRNTILEEISALPSGGGMTLQARPAVRNAGRDYDNQRRADQHQRAEEEAAHAAEQHQAELDAQRRADDAARLAAQRRADQQEADRVRAAAEAARRRAADDELDARMAENTRQNRALHGELDRINHGLDSVGRDLGQAVRSSIEIDRMRRGEGL